MAFCSEIALTKRKKRKYVEWEQNKAYLFRGSLEIILNKEFADGPIDEPDRTYYNIANPGERRTELTILEPQRCQAKTHRTVKQCTAAERKRDVVQCGRRRRSLILTLYCCVLAFNSPSTVCRFPYFQAWLGSS